MCNCVIVLFVYPRSSVLMMAQSKRGKEGEMHNFLGFVFMYFCVIVFVLFLCNCEIVLFLYPLSSELMMAQSKRGERRRNTFE